MIESAVPDSPRFLELLSIAIRVAESERQRGTVNLLDRIRDKEEKALWMLCAATRPDRSERLPEPQDKADGTAECTAGAVFQRPVTKPESKAT